MRGSEIGERATHKPGLLAYVQHMAQTAQPAAAKRLFELFAHQEERRIKHAGVPLSVFGPRLGMVQAAPSPVSVGQMDTERPGVAEQRHFGLEQYRRKEEVRNMPDKDGKGPKGAGLRDGHGGGKGKGANKAAGAKKGAKKGGC